MKPSMFCSKCGTRALDGTEFCQKCGARLIKDESAKPKPIEVPKPNAIPENASTEKRSKRTTDVAISPAVQEAYNRLTASTEHCSKIKQTTIDKAPGGATGSALVIRGNFHKYIYLPIEKTGKVLFSWKLRWSLYLVYFPILLCDALFLQFFVQEEYLPLLSICCLIGCIIWLPFLVLSYRERAEITAYINRTLNCAMKAPSKIPSMAVGVLNFIEMGLCIASLIFVFSSSREVSNTIPNYTSPNLDENPSLVDTQPALSNEQTIASIEEAQTRIETWIADHPLGELAGVIGISDSSTDSGGNEAYEFELWIEPREFAGAIYVRKSDGYMTFQQFDFDDGMSLDDWYKEWSGGEESTNSLTYKGISLANLLGCAPVQLYENFGAPTSGTPVNGEMYLGGEYYGYDGIMFLIDYATSTVGWITGAADAVEVNGKTLDKSRAEILELLGEPSYEEDFHDEMGEFEDYYYMQYVDGGAGTVLCITFSDSNHAANSIEFYHYGDGN